MGWSIGYDPKWSRDVGYGVPAWCDHPDCTNKIDRGLSYVCGSEMFGGEHGCGLYFCENHLNYPYTEDGLEDLFTEDGKLFPHMCERCCAYHENPSGTVEEFIPKPDHPEWVEWKLTDESWAQWRAEHPYHVAAMKLALGGDA